MSQLYSQDISIAVGQNVPLRREEIPVQFSGSAVRLRLADYSPVHFPCPVGGRVNGVGTVVRCRLLYSTLIAAPRLLPQVPLSYYVFNGLLLLLQLLHIVWSYMIVQSLGLAFQSGMVNR